MAIPPSCIHTSPLHVFIPPSCIYASLHSWPYLHHVSIPPSIHSHTSIMNLYLPPFIAIPQSCIYTSIHSWPYLHHESISSSIHGHTSIMCLNFPSLKCKLSITIRCPRGINLKENTSFYVTIEF